MFQVKKNLSAYNALEYLAINTFKFIHTMYQKLRLWSTRFVFSKDRYFYSNTVTNGSLNTRRGFNWDVAYGDIIPPIEYTSNPRSAISRDEFRKLGNVTKFKDIGRTNNQSSISAAAHQQTLSVDSLGGSFYKSPNVKKDKSSGNGGQTKSPKKQSNKNHMGMGRNNESGGGKMKGSYLNPTIKGKAEDPITNSGVSIEPIDKSNIKDEFNNKIGDNSTLSKDKKKKDLG